MHLGIDLGTTFSLISYVNAQGIPTLVPDQFNSDLFHTASVIHFAEEGAYVGQIVEDLLLDDASLPIFRFVKLAMGEEQLTYPDSNNNEWRAEAISALYLRKLKNDVDTHVGEEIESLVIAIPANFNDSQRRATKVAARLAGLPSPTLIEEPIAAATFYGANQSTEETVFIYDLGGGTFDATVLQSSPDGLYALATQGRNDVGGKNINEALCEFLAKEYQARFGSNPLANQASKAVLELFAEQAKIKLSAPGVGQVQQTLFISGNPFEVILTRSQFEKLIQPLINESIKVAQDCVNDAGLDWDMIDKVILAGGSSMLPLVKQSLVSQTGVAQGKLITRQPHQAIAYGAALIAMQLAGKNANSPKLHRTIASNDLGLRVWNKALNAPDIEVLIKRNTPLPTEFTRVFYTTREDQKRLIIELVQRPADASELERSLGHFEFGPISQPRKNLPVEVTIKADMEGLLHLSARDPDSGQQINQTIGHDGDSFAPWFNRQQMLVNDTVINS